MAAMNLDKMELCGRPMNVGRPRGYVEPLPGYVPSAAPVNGRVTRHPTSISGMTISILSSPISISHIPYPISISRLPTSISHIPYRSPYRYPIDIRYPTTSASLFLLAPASTAQSVPVLGSSYIHHTLDTSLI